MRLAGPLPIGHEGGGWNPDLLGDQSQHACGDIGQIHDRATRESEHTKLDGEAEAIAPPAVAVDHKEIFGVSV